MPPWITSTAAFLHAWCSNHTWSRSSVSQHLSGAPLGHGVPGDTFSLGLRAPSLWEIKGSALLFLQKQVSWAPGVVAGAGRRVRKDLTPAISRRGRDRPESAVLFQGQLWLVSTANSPPGRETWLVSLSWTVYVFPSIMPPSSLQVTEEQPLFQRDCAPRVAHNLLQLHQNKTPTNTHFPLSGKKKVKYGYFPLTSVKTFAVIS